jgi:hypothetical protein
VLGKCNDISCADEHKGQKITAELYLKTIKI